MRRSVRTMSIVIVGAGLAGGTAATELREQGTTGRSCSSAPRSTRPTSARRCRRGTSSATTRSTTPSSTRGSGTPSTTSTCGSASRARRSTPMPSGVDHRRRRPTTGCCSRPAPSRDGCAGRGQRRAHGVPAHDRGQRPLKEAFGAGGRIVVVGAGWIGLEVGRGAREAGCDVTVFETAELPLLRVLGPTVAQVFADLHREHGVDLRLGASVTAADLRGADLVVAGVGCEPARWTSPRSGRARRRGRRARGRPAAHVGAVGVRRR